MSVIVALAPPPILQFFDNNGKPNAGGSVLTQVGGVNYATYQDSAGATPLPNPIPLNSRGEVSNASGTSCQLFLASGVAYTFTLYDANGNQLNQASYTSPPVSSGSSAANQLITLTVSSIANLRLVTKSAGLVVQVTGYYASGDGGGGTYWYNAADTTSADNGGTIIVAADGGRWYLQVTGQVTVKQFGATGNGTTDDTVAIQNAMNSNSGPVEVYFPKGTYKYSSLTFNYSGIMLKGAGRKNTVLVTTSLSGVTISTIALRQSGSSRTTITDIGMFDMTVNYNSLNSSGTNAAIGIMGAYNYKFSNLDINPNGNPLNPGIQISSNAQGLLLVDECYVGGFDRVDTGCIQLSPSGALTGSITTQLFSGCSFTFLNISGNGVSQPVLGVSFINPTVQGNSALGYPVNKIQINYATNISFVSGDFEGDAGNTLYSISNSQNILSLNNNLNTNPGGPPTWPGIYYSDSNNNRLVQLLDQMDSPWLSAPVGVIGEQVQSLNQTALSSSSAANLTSITLTPGDWDIYAGIGLDGATPNIVNGQLAISTISASLSSSIPGFSYSSYYTNNSAYGGTSISMNAQISVTSTYYLVHSESGAGVGVSSVTGSIWAKRRRDGK